MGNPKEGETCNYYPSYREGKRLREPQEKFREKRLLGIPVTFSLVKQYLSTSKEGTDRRGLRKGEAERDTTPQQIID